MLKCHKLLLLLLTFSIAHAQDLDVEEAPEIRRYTVEVIIFKYAQDVGTGSELFVPEEITIAEIPLMEATPPVIEPPAETNPSYAGEGAARFVSDIVKLKETDYTMRNILDRLERLDVYEPIMHFGWTQSTWPEHDKEPVDLSRFAAPPEGLAGELTLYLSRFLHLVVDLELEEAREEQAVPDDPMLSYGDYRSLSEIRRQPAPVLYSIEEDRIFRSGELRYYDHPRFGVLARVSRVEDEMEEDAGEDGELLGYPVE